MDKEDILYLCGIGDFVQVDFEGESVTGQVERVSAAVLFIVRSDDQRRQGISLDKIASISPLPSGTPVKSAKGKASDAVAQPSGPDQTACLAQAARLIVLPQPVLQGHREDVKAALKNTREISIAWSGLDSVFQDARRSNALELKRPQIMQRMSALLAEYPGARPVYVYAAEIQAAFEAWESAWGLYCQGGDYQNALYAAQQADNPAAILHVLQCAMKKILRSRFYGRDFFTIWQNTVPRALLPGCLPRWCRSLLSCRNWPGSAAGACWRLGRRRGVFPGTGNLPLRSF